MGAAVALLNSNSIISRGHSYIYIYIFIVKRAYRTTDGAYTIRTHTSRHKCLSLNDFFQLANACLAQKTQDCYRWFGRYRFQLTLMLCHCHWVAVRSVVHSVVSFANRCVFAPVCAQSVREGGGR